MKRRLALLPLPWEVSDDELIMKNRKKGRKTLIWVYYGGHGAMDNFTSMILNEGKIFNLEWFIRTLAKGKDTYVIGLLDCCRERQDFLEWRGGGCGGRGEEWG